MTKKSKHKKARKMRAAANHPTTSRKNTATTNYFSNMSASFIYSFLFFLNYISSATAFTPAPSQNYDTKSTSWWSDASFTLALDPDVFTSPSATFARITANCSDVLSLSNVANHTNLNFNDLFGWFSIFDRDSSFDLPDSFIYDDQAFVLIPSGQHKSHYDDAVKCINNNLQSEFDTEFFTSWTWPIETAFVGGIAIGAIGGIACLVIIASLCSHQRQANPPAEQAIAAVALATPNEIEMGDANSKTVVAEAKPVVKVVETEEQKWQKLSNEDKWQLLLTKKINLQKLVADIKKSTTNSNELFAVPVIESSLELIDVPSSYVCVITQEVISDPVLANGHNYERTSVMKYIGKRDPLNANLIIKELVDNIALKGEIHDFLDQKKRNLKVIESSIETIQKTLSEKQKSVIPFSVFKSKSDKGEKEIIDAPKKSATFDA